MPRQKISAIDWVYLSEAAQRLQARLCLPRGMADQMLQTAVRTGNVPIRGVPNRYSSLIPEPIAQKVSSSMHVDVLLSRISERELGEVIWRDVETDWAECATFCESHLTPSWVQLPRPQRGGRKTSVQTRQEEILAAFDSMKISCERGGLIKAAKHLRTKFKNYKEGTIRKLIQQRFRERCTKPTKD
jgi:hypothetical protein